MEIGGMALVEAISKVVDEVALTFTIVMMLVVAVLSSWETRFTLPSEELGNRFLLIGGLALHYLGRPSR